MVENILLGVLASFIASIIWWGLSALYTFRTREKVEYKLMLLRNDNYDYQKFLDYKDYDLALHQVQRMLDEIEDLYAYIKPLAYFSKKRKLIYSLINSLYFVLSRFQRYYVGYKKESEKEICCEKAKRELCISDENKNDFLTDVIIELLSELNQRKRLKTILCTAICFNGDKNIGERKRLYKELIHVDSFKDSFSKEIANKYFLSTKIFTRKEYEKLIDSL